jgi:hypothetical protein
MMLVAYGTVGILQTIAGYFAWLWVYYDYGFTIDSLLGASIGYRDSWWDLDEERR